MRPFKTFTSFPEPHAVTFGFVQFPMDGNIIFLLLVLHEKNAD